MKFKSFSNLPEAIEAPVGDRFQPEYSLEYSKDGVPHLIQTGTIDLYEYIQSFKDECDFNRIIRRFENGDVNALQRAQGVYADVSDAPKTPGEALSLMGRVEDYYNSLSPSVASKFGSYEAFLSGLLDGSAFAVFEGGENSGTEQLQSVQSYAADT